MLTRTYIHLAGVTEEMERRLWRQGAHDWQTLLATPDRWELPEPYRTAILQGAAHSLHALERGDYAFFAGRLPLREHWRAFAEFQHRTAYLDIETDGGTTVTVIGVYDGVEVHQFVHGINLHAFSDFIRQFALLVTFNGLNFDLPLLGNAFPGLVFDQLHIDLCPTLRRLGLRGGLKRIEQTLGLLRDPDVEGMDGLAAVRLWQAYCAGHSEALEMLLRYNREDILNLKPLAELAYQRLKERLLQK
ncbi:MAG: ribonuclease H-like domain-containing protein [Armatimonadota bacterium]